MQNWVPIFRLPTKTSPLLPPSSSSSSIFLNVVFERNGEAILWILPRYKVRFIPILKSKHQLNTHKHAGNRTSTKKSKKKTGARDAWSCAPGCMTVRPSPRPTRGALCLVRSRHFSNYAFWTTLDHGMCLGSSCFGPIGLAFQPLFTWLGINSHISPKTCLESC